MLHSAFYRFAPVDDPLALAQMLRGLAHGLGGSIIVATEGLNGTVAGTPEQVAAFEHALQQPDVLHGALHGMVFKRSACDRPPFGRLKVSIKPEIVALGMSVDRGGLSLGSDAGTAEQARVLSGVFLPPPDERDASHLSPSAWRSLLARKDLVLLDNRNHFEYRLGHFRGAIDPQVHHFRDFAAYVLAHAPSWRAQGRPVAMYCTGGIRCDKTAPWMRSLGLDVLQLQGGILHYFQNMDDAERDWQGECFVFDQRLALDSRLQPTGVSAERVFDPAHPDEAWRLNRALRLAAAAAELPPSPGSGGAADADSQTAGAAPATDTGQRAAGGLGHGST